MKTAFVFPGPGLQGVGMGKALAEAFPVAREVFDRVDAALGENLCRADVRGAGGRTDADRQRPAGADGDEHRGAARAREPRPASTSRATRPSSPAIRSANIPRSAPPARSPSRMRRGCLRLRGQAMQKAVPVGEGAMAAILGLDFGAVVGDRDARRRATSI